VPQEPYSDAGRNYNDAHSRTSIEQDDPSVRPAISGSVDNMDDYDIVFLGYPIWHGQAPRIISTFLESYDFSGKTIIPLCTSGSSGIGSGASNLHTLAKNAAWLSGTRFVGGTSRDDISSRIDGLEPGAEASAPAQSNTMYIHVGENTLTATLLGKINDVTADELREILGIGDVTVTLSLE
jgi:hypothetical protein